MAIISMKRSGDKELWEIPAFDERKEVVTETVKEQRK